MSARSSTLEALARRDGFELFNSAWKNGHWEVTVRTPTVLAPPVPYQGISQRGAPSIGRVFEEYLIVASAIDPDFDAAPDAPTFIPRENMLFAQEVLLAWLGPIRYREYMAVVAREARRGAVVRSASTGRGCVLILLTMVGALIVSVAAGKGIS